MTLPWQSTVQEPHKRFSLPLPAQMFSPHLEPAGHGCIYTPLDNLFHNLLSSSLHSQNNLKSRRCHPRTQHKTQLSHQQQCSSLLTPCRPTTAFPQNWSNTRLEIELALKAQQHSSGKGSIYWRAILWHLGRVPTKTFPFCSRLANVILICSLAHACIAFYFASCTLRANMYKKKNQTIINV